MKNLIAYFSATGTTKKVAVNLARAVDGDLFEIIPKQKYTNKDLDWTNKKSRSSIEMNNLSYRPQILNKIDNIIYYDNIFLGFPIWWYREPTIIDTFLEQYDFSNKTIIPFATSGGSGMGNTSKNIQSLAKNSIVLEGKRFLADESIDELKIWSKKYNK